MNKVTYMEDSNGTEHVVIDHGNGQFTSMPKSTYDEQQAEAKAPKVVDETTSL